MNNDRRAWQTVAAMSRMVLQASGDDAHLVLDQMLVGALFNKKEPQAVGDAHPRGDVLQRLLGKLLLFTHVVRPTENVRAATPAGNTASTAVGSILGIAQRLPLARSSMLRKSAAAGGPSCEARLCREAGSWGWNFGAFRFRA